ncbi:hypothetical protein D3C79_771470 [compost metagenome]
MGRRPALDPADGWRCHRALAGDLWHSGGRSAAAQVIADHEQRRFQTPQRAAARTVVLVEAAVLCIVMGEYRRQYLAGPDVPLRVQRTALQRRELQVALGRIALLGYALVRPCRRPGEGQLGWYLGKFRLNLLAELHHRPTQRCSNAAVVDHQLLADQRVDLGHAGIEAQLGVNQYRVVQFSAVDRVAGADQ